MAQITNGIRKILSNAHVYNAMQNIMGAKKVRKELIDEYIKPEENLYVLDIGCGTSEILDFLPKSTKYFGYDISELYIEASRKKYGDRGVYVCGLFSEYGNELKYDVVLLLGVLHHLSDDAAVELLEKVKCAMKNSGRLITIDPCYAMKQNAIAKFIISRDRGQCVRDEYGYKKITTSVFNNVNRFIKHRKWIPYTHCIMICKK